MRRSRLYKGAVWPLFALLVVPTTVLAFGLLFHPRQTGYLGFAGVTVVWMLNIVALIVSVIRAKRRAARGVVEMTNEPDPAKGEFA